MESEIDIINELSFNFAGIFTFQFGLEKSREKYFIINRQPMKKAIRAIEIKYCTKNYDIFQRSAIDDFKIYIDSILRDLENKKYPFDQLLKSSKVCWGKLRKGYMNFNELKIEINKLDSEEFKLLGKQINWYKDYIS